MQYRFRAARFLRVMVAVVFTVPHQQLQLIT
jgi:hypothetical protein